jgi:hypothetical protein
MLGLKQLTTSLWILRTLAVDRLTYTVFFWVDSPPPNGMFGKIISGGFKYKYQFF